MRLALLLLVPFFACPSLADGGAAKPKKWNIICVVTDDQAAWSIGAYGNKESRTPAMDRLARDGVLFTRAFTATPVCSPSRASYLTGRYGTQVNITDWISPKEAKAGVGLPSDTITWMEVLRRAGWRTGLIGKWHLGALPQFHPTKQGFQHFFGFLGGGTTPMNPTLEVNGKETKLKGTLPDLLTDDAIAFIKKNKDSPFALSLHFRAPHLPYIPVPEADAAPFKDLDPTIPAFPGLDVNKVKTWTRDYYGSIHSVDRNLGRLLAFLEEAGLADSTIILFTSDHGYMIGHHGLNTKGNASWIAAGHTGRRPNMFDVSLQVPLIIRWPRVVRPGTKLDAMVSNIDTFATVLGMLDAPPPKDYRQHGQDFTPLLRGDKATWRDAVFAQYDMHNGDKAHMRSLRGERWHLVRQHLGNQPDELFDLRNDPEEMKNLYNDPRHRQTRDELQRRLDEWMRSVDDPLIRNK
ncbi:MAG: sulfatase-like hydrolase/transferase [Gemmataceae bacterium]|nr:sulfatase-like hydrolase/transferase [Gemmataceae bacterium]